MMDLNSEDSLAYYLALIENNVDTVISGVVQLCAYKPQRVMLLLGSPVSAGAFFTTNANVVAAANAGAQKGFFVNAASLPMVFNARDNPVLTQHDWYSPTPTTGSVLHLTVIEAVVREWPRKGSAAHEALSSLIRPGGSPNGIASATRSKSPSLWDMVFSACRGESNNRSGPANSAGAGNRITTRASPNLAVQRDAR